MLVDVLADVPGDEIAVEAARRDHRDFRREGHETLEDRGLAAERAEGDGEIGALADQGLALAVIAEPPRLQDRGPPDLRHGAGERAGVVHLGEGRDLDAEPRDEVLLDQPVLRQRQNRGRGPHRRMRSEKFRRARRDVLEFVGDDVDRGGETRQRLFVVIGRDRAGGGDFDGGVVLGGR